MNTAYKQRTGSYPTALSAQRETMKTDTMIKHGDNEFQIYATARTSSRYLTMQEGNNFINRKILIINNSIIQK